MMNIGKPRAGGARGNRRASFTLIELLVVVAVILILMSISLKVMSLVNDKARVGKTIKVLEQVKNALGAYYAQYGVYPPVQKVKAQYVLFPTTSSVQPTNAYESAGLVSFIYDGVGHNADAGPWQHYLSETPGSKWRTNYIQQVGTFNPRWTNEIHTISDGWGAEIHYSSAPPDYQQYKLWSSGPTTNASDDIGVQAVD